MKYIIVPLFLLFLFCSSSFAFMDSASSAAFGNLGMPNYGYKSSGMKIKNKTVLSSKYNKDNKIKLNNKENVNKNIQDIAKTPCK